MRKTTTFVFALSLCATAVFAQGVKAVNPPGGTRFVEPAQAKPDALTKIFSNLGPPTNAYVATGYYVAGPNSVLGNSQSVGLPFAVTRAATATQIRAGISWNSAGANAVRLSLYSDAGGVPGTLLAGPVGVTNLPVFGVCCTLAVANIPATSLAAGTLYWIVADNPASGPGSNSEDVWDASPLDNIGANVAAGGWFSFSSNFPAGAVYGSIP